MTQGLAKILHDAYTPEYRSKFMFVATNPDGSRRNFSVELTAEELEGLLVPYVQAQYPDATIKLENWLKLYSHEPKPLMMNPWD